MLVSTYNMISFPGRRSKEALEVMADVEAREWGLLLMDEVHSLISYSLTITSRFN